jgi:hypothetical protein
MGMAAIRFYKNPYQYPKYTEALATYGDAMECTPVGLNLHGGTIRVKGSMSDFMSCNYMNLSRDGYALWAWIDDAKYMNENAFEITYTVDAWRTYKNNVRLGTQFIKRSPTPTNLKDSLLGSLQPFMDVQTQNYTIGDPTKRVAVVQVRASSGETFSNTPVQPTPYQFYCVEYPANTWQDCAALASLMGLLPANGQTKNIVTIYSTPYFDTSGLPSNPLIVEDTTGATLGTISGFKVVSTTTDMSGIVHHETSLNLPAFSQNIFTIPHSVQLVIPEAGILAIPDELLSQDLYLREDIDIFSGACNYMLTTGTGELFAQSVRGSSVSSIPILSNPEDTYLSQNQNALTTSLMGDVANIALGAAIMYNPEAAAIRAAGMAAGGMDKGMAMWGAQTIVQGGSGVLDNLAQRADGGHNYANPPAFLGQALGANFNGKFWVVYTTMHVTNADNVHNLFGYPYNMIDTLTFPNAGYIETQNCSVESYDGSVPRWALNEINQLFDNGILVK